MLPPLLASHMGGWGYGRQVYGLVWWIWYGLYACVKMLYYVVCATIALSWLDSAVNCFCAGLVYPKPQNACRGICRTDSAIASLHSPHEIRRCRIIRHFRLRVYLFLHIPNWRLHSV